MGVYALGLASGQTTAEQHRWHLAAVMAQGGTAGNARSGVIPGHQAADLVGITNMSCAIKPFSAWIDGASSTAQAGYNFVSDADKTINFDPGEPAVSRVDRVYAVVYHALYDASGNTLADVVYVKGQATGTPNNPPVPTALLLHEVTVPAGASSGTGGINFGTQAADKRVYTTAAGGMIPVASQAERDAIVNPYRGMTVWRRDYAWQETHDGTAWRVQGVATVPAAANLNRITHPIAGQLAWLVAEAQLHRYTGSAWQLLADPADINAAWVNWNAPSLQWTSGGTPQPSIGDGTLTGRYIIRGDVVTYTGRLFIGSTTTLGGGNWLLNLPFAAQSGSFHCGAAVCYDASNGLAHRPATVWMSSATQLRISSSAGDVNATTPFSWFNGDQLRWSITYEPA